MKDEKWNKEGSCNYNEMKLEELDGVSGGAVRYDALDTYIDISRDGSQTKEQFKSTFCAYWYSMQEFRSEFSTNGSNEDLQEIMKRIDETW